MRMAEWKMSPPPHHKKVPPPLQFIELNREEKNKTKQNKKHQMQYNYSSLPFEMQLVKAIK